jgi:hypothetical protein
MSKDVFKQLAATSSGSDFVKLQDGDTVRLRIISDPIWGHEQFHEGRPYRWRTTDPKPAGLPANGERAKPFIAFVVYQYGAGVKIWQFSQRSVIDQLEMIFKDDDTHWSSFVLNLRRKGSAMDTQYMITPQVSILEGALIKFATVVDQYVDLTALYVGDSPFLQQLPVIDLTPETEPVQAPTPNPSSPF